jgi:hypothetical protein
MIILVIFIFLTFNIYLFYHKSKANKTSKKRRDDFWKKELKANQTPKKDLSNLNYIHIPINELPFADCPEDKDLNSIQEQIIQLSKKSIVNFTGMTNTDLKLQYGTANIKTLMEWDNNYTQLVQTIYQWGLYYYSHQQLMYAKKILEYGVNCNTDISKNYTLLANIYIKLDQSDKIDSLINHANSLQTIMKENIVRSLQELKYSTYLL